MSSVGAPGLPASAEGPVGAEAPVSEGSIGAEGAVGAGPVGEGHGGPPSGEGSSVSSW